MRLPRYYLSIGLLATSVIAYELTLMQVFSITQWYHFAYMIISVGMLGFGVAGTALALWENWLVARFERAFPLLLLLCGASMGIATQLYTLDAVQFDTYLLFSDYREVGKLLLAYLIFFTPFFLAALAIGLAFVRFVQQIGQLYFADLLGSGLGGLLAILLMWYVFPGMLAVLIGLLPIAGGWIAMNWQAGSKVKVIAFLAPLAVLWGLLQPPRPQPSQYKSYSKTMLLPDAKTELENSSPFGLLQVVSSPALRFAPALSLNFQGEVPVRKVVFNNGEAVGSVLPKPPAGSTHILDFTTAALPYYLNKPEKVLALKAGTGEEVAHAISRKVPQIRMVESNPVLLSMLKEQLADETDSLLYQPGLQAHAMEARTYLLTHPNSYQLILMPTTSAFGGTAGLNALQEQYGMTVSAFRSMWRQLGPNGMISISSWMDYPVRHPLKILATLVEVLEAEGIEKPIRHLAAVRSWGTITFVVKRSPFTTEQKSAVRAFCEERLFDPTILEGLQPEERQQYNQLQDSLFFGYLDAILSPQREQFYEDYDFNIRPATDGRPYFSQFLKWQSLPALTELYGSRGLPFLEIGYLIIWLTLGQVLLLALLLIILPLFRIGFQRGHRRWTLLYFGGIGLAYLFVEIVLIQQFILFFGNPIYATAGVISCLLVASGAGSYFSARLPGLTQPLWKVPAIIALLLLLFAVFLQPILLSAIGLPIWLKVILLIPLIAPLGFFMGMPFPDGIRYLSESKRGSVPWAWGINGYFSVISTALAAILAMEFGFFWVLLAAGLLYGMVGGVSSGR